MEKHPLLDPTRPRKTMKANCPNCKTQTRFLFHEGSITCPHCKEVYGWNGNNYDSVEFKHTPILNIPFDQISTNPFDPGMIQRWGISEPILINEDHEVLDTYENKRYQTLLEMGWTLIPCLVARKPTGLMARCVFCKYSWIPDRGDPITCPYCDTQYWDFYIHALYHYTKEIGVYELGSDTII